MISEASHEFLANEFSALSQNKALKTMSHPIEAAPASIQPVPKLQLTAFCGTRQGDSFRGRGLHHGCVPPES